MAHQLICRDDTRWTVDTGALGDLIVRMPYEPLLATYGLERFARPRVPGQGWVILFAPALQRLRGWLAAHGGPDKEWSAPEALAILKAAGERELEALRAEPDQSPTEDPDSPPYRPPAAGPAGPTPRHPPGTSVSADCVTGRLTRRSGQP
ncbi:MAG: hypothetical protein INR63_26345 [Actinomycetospora chiangmaiensis]|nr:hypothetical protein [Actinomycetospora chiangmaiensis]